MTGLEYDRQSSVGTGHQSVSSLESGRVDDVDRIEPVREDDVVSRISTHMSHGPDAPMEQLSSVVEVPDEVYDRFPRHRKLIMVTVLSFLSLLAPISSTTVLSAIPEVASEYSTTGSIVNLSNAMYMLFMGLSPVFWGPMSQVYGRRMVNLSTAVLFFGCSVGTALSPNLPAFFVFRILTAFEGTAFILVGSACLSDIYRPTERATAMGWFLLGTLIGPAFGPFVGGIIVTYTSWRVIFWLQSGLSGLACVLTFFFLPETIYHKRIDDLEGYSGKEKLKVLWGMVNPVRVLRLYIYPNLVMTSLASSSLLWNMYSLLTPIRYVLNPRFHLETPLQSGLFYLAPGCGYLVGTFMGGRYADFIVRKWIKKRGVRVPEDRLRSALPFMGIAVPGCMLIYGWGVDRNVGGIPLAVVMMFLQGVAQLLIFPSLNTYCLDVMQGCGAEVIAGNYFVRYLFACLASALVLPAVEQIGVGWFTTISVAFLVVGTLATAATVWWGKGWRERIDEKKRRNKLKKANAKICEDGELAVEDKEVTKEMRKAGRVTEKGKDKESKEEV